MGTPTDEIDDITEEEYHFFGVLKNGKVLLFLSSWDKVPPSYDSITGVQSKDLIISSDPPLSVRIFQPKTCNLGNKKKLPILVYLHGGGFCMQSASSPQYHKFCQNVAADAEAIVVSVEYGMFPTRPMPACYDDSWAAVQWVAGHVSRDGPEEWLNEHGDFGRVFVGGDSAGGNISHSVAFRASSVGLPEGVRLVGAIIVHPFFGGTEFDRTWLRMYPGNEKGIDHPFLNPSEEDLRRLGCEKVLIFLGEKDYLKPVGMNYYEKLEKSGFQGSVELFVNEDGHCFHLLDSADKNKILELMHKFVSFIKN